MHGYVRSPIEMPQSSDSKSDYCSLGPSPSLVSRKQHMRSQGNRAAKKDH